MLPVDGWVRWVAWSLHWLDAVTLLKLKEMMGALSHFDSLWRSLLFAQLLTLLTLKSITAHSTNILGQAFSLPGLGEEQLKTEGSI